MICRNWNMLMLHHFAAKDRSMSLVLYGEYSQGKVRPLYGALDEPDQKDVF